MADDDERYTALRAVLRRLESAGSASPDLISLYIPSTTPIAAVIRYLADEYARAGALREGTAVQAAYGSILAHLKRYETLPKNGLALFCGAGGGGNDRCTVVEPPEPLGTYLFRHSSSFELGPLRGMLDAKTVYGLVVLDLGSAWWGVLRGGRVVPAGSATSPIPGKQRKGGQSSARYQRLREIAVDAFFTRVGDHASRAFRAERGFFQRFGGVLIGGRSPTADDFLNGRYLHHEIQSKVIGPFPVAAIDARGLAELADAGQEAIRAREDADEMAVLERFTQELANADGLAAYGEASVRNNLAVGAVGTLLLSAGLRHPRRQITCQQCGHAEERTMELAPGTTVQDILAHTCRICAAPIVEEEGVFPLEDLMREADLRGARTTIVPASPGKGAEFLAAFGGVAAILRYRTGF